MAAVGGVRQVTIGSQTVSVGESVNVPFHHKSREIQGGETGPAGYSEREIAGYVEVEVTITASTDIEALAEPNLVVQVDFRSGRSYVIDGALLVGEPPPFDGATGKVTLRYESATGPGRWL